MMSTTFEGATNVFCDNNYVVINSTIPESSLKSKQNSVAYHRVRESQAGILSAMLRKVSLPTLQKF